MLPLKSLAHIHNVKITKYEHLDEIRKEYVYSSFTLHEYRSLSKFLHPQAMSNGNSLHLIQVALVELRKRKIILPAMATIERAEVLPLTDLLD